VFGARAGEAAANDSGQRSAVSGQQAGSEIRNPQSAISTAVRKRVKRLMWERVGILRDRDGLARALREFDQIAAGELTTSSRNFVTLARLVATAALWREESRGGHFRTDFPETYDSWRVHSVQRLDAEIVSAPEINFRRGTVV
jgi:L-aspartate oxidase